MQGDQSSGAYGPVARAIAFLGALVVGAYLASAAASLVARGYPLTAATVALSATPFLALLALLALAPRWLQARLAPVSPVRLGDARHVFALVILAATVTVLFGLNSFTEAAFIWESLARHGDTLEGLQDFSLAGLLQGLAVQFLLLTVAPVVWLAVVHRRGARGVAEALRLTTRRLPWGVALGVGIAVAGIAALVAVAFAAQWLGVPLPVNERAVAIAAVLTPATAVVVALLSSTGEEVFFRGFLQPRVGLVGQAALFSVAHVSYLNALQLVVTFALGLAFGLAAERTESLAAPIAAHFSFNLIMLLAAIYAPPGA